MRCQNCGHELKNNDEFCIECGTKVADSIIHDKVKRTKVNNKKNGKRAVLCFFGITALIICSTFFLLQGREIDDVQIVEEVEYTRSHDFLYSEIVENTFNEDGLLTDSILYSDENKESESINISIEYNESSVDIFEILYGETTNFEMIDQYDYQLNENNQIIEINRKYYNSGMNNKWIDTKYQFQYNTEGKLENIDIYGNGYHRKIIYQYFDFNGETIVKEDSFVTSKGERTTSTGSTKAVYYENDVIDDLLSNLGIKLTGYKRSEYWPLYDIGGFPYDTSDLSFKSVKKYIYGWYDSKSNTYLGDSSDQWEFYTYYDNNIFIGYDSYETTKTHIDSEERKESFNYSILHKDNKSYYLVENNSDKCKQLIDGKNEKYEKNIRYDEDEYAALYEIDYTNENKIVKKLLLVKKSSELYKEVTQNVVDKEKTNEILDFVISQINTGNGESNNLDFSESVSQNEEQNTNQFEQNTQEIQNNEQNEIIEDQQIQESLDQNKEEEINKLKSDYQQVDALLNKIETAVNNDDFTAYDTLYPEYLNLRQTIDYQFKNDLSAVFMSLQMFCSDDDINRDYHRQMVLDGINNTRTNANELINP